MQGVYACNTGVDSGITSVDARNTGVYAVNVTIVLNRTVHTTDAFAALPSLDIRPTYDRMQAAYTVCSLHTAVCRPNAGLHAGLHAGCMQPALRLV